MASNTITVRMRRVAPWRMDLFSKYAKRLRWLPDWALNLLVRLALWRFVEARIGSRYRWYYSVSVKLVKGAASGS